MQNDISNFTYFNPTKVVFGKNQISTLDQLIPPNKKVLILMAVEV